MEATGKIDQSAHRSAAAYTESQNFWRSRFGEPVALVFRAHPAEGERSKAHAAVWPIPQSVWSRVERMTAGAGCTSTDFLLAAVAVCLSRTYTVEDGVVIGLGCSNRHSAGQRSTGSVAGTGVRAMGAQCLHPQRLRQPQLQPQLPAHLSAAAARPPSRPDGHVQGMTGGGQGQGRRPDCP